MDTLNPIYCLNCKAPLEETATFCLMCGRDQRLSTAVLDNPLPGRQRNRPERRASDLQIVAVMANVIAAVAITPIVFFCVWRHPFGCLLAIAIGVLPFLAVFYKQFRRQPVVPAAIACCLCLFCNQVLDKLQESRAAARSERLAEVMPPDNAAPSTNAIRPSTNITNASPELDVPPTAQAPARRPRRGMFLKMFRNRMHRRSDGQQPGRLSRHGGAGQTDLLRRGLGQKMPGLSPDSGASDD